MLMKDIMNHDANQYLRRCYLLFVSQRKSNAIFEFT